ncbi:hypothetical protein Tsubulata_050349, partial [Turnera subulata]
MAAMDVSSDNGGNNNNNRSEEKVAAAVTSSRRGPEYSPPKLTQTEEEDDAISEDPLSPEAEEKEAAIWRAIEEKDGKGALENYLAEQAGEPAQLAIEYYKNKEGVQLQLTEMINGTDQLTKLGFIT